MRICSAFYNDSLKQIVNLIKIEILFLYLTVDLIFLIHFILILIKIFVLFDNKVDYILFGNVGSAERKSFD